MSPLEFEDINIFQKRWCGDFIENLIQLEMQNVHLKQNINR